MAQQINYPKISSRYKITSTLGSGGQSTAYLAEDQFLQKQVVIKEVAGDKSKSLKNEFALLSALKHPNLIQVLELIRNNNDFFLIQSYASGADFISWVNLEQSSIRICLGAAAILRGLQYIHTPSASGAECQNGGHNSFSLTGFSIMFSS